MLISKLKFSEETITGNQYNNVDLSTTPADSMTEKEKKTSSFLKTSSVKENNTTYSYESIDDENVYMNETFSIGIPLEKLDFTVSKQGTKEYNDFKKEYAVSLDFLPLLVYFSNSYF